MSLEEEGICFHSDASDEDISRENTTDLNEIVSTPKIGMNFDSLDALFLHYKIYGRQEGFGVKKKTSRKSLNGKITFVCFSCSRARKSQPTKQNFLIPNPQMKTDCKARINATLFEDGKCKINYVVLEHNHCLSPHRSRFYTCNREISIGVQRRLELNDRAGVSVAKKFQTLVVEAGGHDKVPFLEKDCRNFVDKARRLRLGIGDAKAIHDYFMSMQAKNSSFFYMMDLDDDGRIKNVFWANSRSRALYEEFGDVVTFDTTYMTNKYDLPFAPFVGVNHHRHYILLGCGLLSNEDTNTFIWLFKTWLTCMNECAPIAIITDQDKAMKKAIEVVFPETRHRWCLWHILKKIPEKLRGYKFYEQIKNVLKNVVYDSLTKEEFEEKWGDFLNEFNLLENVWLNDLYEERHRWVPTFVIDTFWAGMSTTQRSESMNSFFDDYVNSKTSLKQFVEQYDLALRNKVEKENLANFQSFSTEILCVTHFEIEKQFQMIYTHSKFKELQHELTRKLYCNVSCKGEKDGAYYVTETLFIGDKQKEMGYNVQFNNETCEVKCACRLFEFKGIICRHALSVLIREHVKSVPEKYIVPRWRKDIKQCHTRIKVNYNEWSGSFETQRYDRL
ncbi:protein FAR-RED IMPAIRED RESPONSE 1-like [Humulus lupulus]|uniref:protein FAR-RED IMPAIRED RESPONSE 1-like n=1 Tax=Humulus lupulus TaxID=3486 RepID=UPI002B40C51C|nr:protein FAR-RED IMPAIRED RESPONSE 1-like [Humulus lupulus]